MTYYKANLGSLEEANPMPKFTGSVQNSYLANSNFLFPDMTIRFQQP